MKRIYIFLAIAALAASCTGRTAPATDAGYPADATVYELNVRQMTPEGTFAAAGDRLASLKDLGVDIVWVMPPYPIGEQGRKGSLGSYYAVRDYCDINPEFGTLADFDAFLDKALEGVGFFTVGYGCTICIGNSGPLIEEVSAAINDNDLAVTAVLSGNRNFHC